MLWPCWCQGSGSTFNLINHPGPLSWGVRVLMSSHAHKMAGSATTSSSTQLLDHALWSDDLSRSRWK